MKYYYYSKFNSDNQESFLTYCTQNNEEKIHMHDFVEIIYIFSGKMIQKINDREYHVSKGDILIVEPGSTHWFKPLCPTAYYNICLNQKKSSALLEDLLKEKAKGAKDHTIFISGETRRRVENVLQNMLIEQTTKSSFSQEIMDSYLPIFLLSIKRTIVDGENDNETNPWNDFEYYIKNNLDTSLTLDEVANRFFYNPSYFSRLFKQKYGINFVEYVLLQRIEKAKELLIKTSKNTKQIAKDLGFSSSSVFCRSFLKICGVTPQTYRNNSLKDNQNKNKSRL